VFSVNDNISIYLSGEKLYGDDFTNDEIEEWFADEAEGYANLGAKNTTKYRYVYHELNNQHGFKFIRQRTFNEALGLGSAYGDELNPIASHIRKITILDPSDAFSDVHEIMGTPCKYAKPNPDGNMPFRSNQFDLITSLGVMHHIPNVSHVMSECYRCLNSGGLMLLREPIVSMGDWTKPRKGLTKRERGIPPNLLNGIIQNAGFKVKRKSTCIFPAISKILKILGVETYNNYAMTLADKLLSVALAWNIKYHRTRLYHKFGPSSAYYILEK